MDVAFLAQAREAAMYVQALRLKIAAPFLTITVSNSRSPRALLWWPFHFVVEF
jgi:hypothetical protein